MKNKKNTILLIRNIAWATVIFILCTMPGQDLPDPHLNIPHLDKVVHFALFFIMALLLSNELEYQTRLSLRNIFLLSVSIVFAYGGIIELLQHYFFKRSGDVFDLIADVAGGIAACLFYPAIRRLKHQIMKKN